MSEHLSGPEPSKRLEQTQRFIAENETPADGPAQIVEIAGSKIDRQAAQFEIAHIIVDFLRAHPEGVLYDEFMMTLGDKCQHLPSSHLDFIPALNMVKYRFDGDRIFFAG